MFESTKKFICQEIKKQLESISLHRHNSFYPILPKSSYTWPEAKGIDETVRYLIQDGRDKTKHISQLQSDLTNIHAHYRTELCGCCCHESVCNKKDGIKYGDECEEHSFPCWYETELSEIEPEKMEAEKEENPCCSNSGNGD